MSTDENKEKIRTFLSRYIRNHELQDDEDIFASGTNPLLLLAELEEMGDCSIVAKSEAIPELDDYDAEKCYVSCVIILA